MRIASSRRVTPRAVNSPVRTVDLLRTVFLKDTNQAQLIEQVALGDLDLVLNVPDAVKIDRARTPNHPYDFITLLEKKLCQVASVLSGNSCDQCSGHEICSCGCLPRIRLTWLRSCDRGEWCSNPITPSYRLKPDSDSH